VDESGDEKRRDAEERKRRAREAARQARSGSIARYLGGDWVEVEPGIFFPPGAPIPASPRQPTGTLPEPPGETLEDALQPDPSKEPPPAAPSTTRRGGLWSRR
jgi:hypothetical protein